MEKKSVFSRSLCLLLASCKVSKPYSQKKSFFLKPAELRKSASELLPRMGGRFLASWHLSDHSYISAHALTLDLKVCTGPETVRRMTAVNSR